MSANGRTVHVRKAIVLVLLSQLAIGCFQSERKDVPLTNGGLRQLEREQWEYTQRQLSACMKAAGFRYFPTAFDEDQVDIPTGDDRDARYLEVTLTVEDAKRKGFGVVAGVGADRVGQDERVDRNAEYVASLSPSDYAAYTLALDGDRRGCTKSAATATARKYDAKEETLTSTAERLRTLVFTDPEFERISDGGSTCMAERGWKDAVITEFDGKIRAEAQQRLDAVAITDTDSQEGAEPPAASYPAADLEKVRSFEVGAATDYVECFDKFRPSYQRLLDRAYDKLA